MSPYSSRLAYSGGKFEGRGMVGVLRVVDAGRVALGPDPEPASGLVLHLWRAEPHLEGDLPREELWRRRPVSEVGAGLVMPEGAVIGALRDPDGRRFIAVSRPVEVTAGDTVELPLAPPVDGADVVVELTRAERARSVTEYDVEATLIVAGEERPPDVRVPSAGNLLAVWYGVPAGAAGLRAGSPREALPVHHLDLTAGTVEHVAAELRPRPELAVELDLPRALDDEPDETATLALRSPPGGAVIARRELPPGSRFERFAAMPLGVVEVVLETAVGEYAVRVDLTSGDDGFVRLAPPLFVLAGTVYLADEGQPAELEFGTVDGETVRAQSDAGGVYEAVLAEPVRSVSIALADRGGAPYIDFFPRAIAETTELDFHLSDARWRARVTDAGSGEPIAGATVILRSQVAAGGAAGREPSKSVAQTAETDVEGLALLPPPRDGELEIRAAAEGYRRMAEPVVVEVDATLDRTVDLVLEPAAPEVRLRLTLADGRPAAGAEVALVETLAAGRELAGARADRDGVARLPATSGVVLARHPAAAFGVRRWEVSADDIEEVRWSLAAPAPRPLRLRVVDEETGEPVPRAEVALWVEGRRLSGPVLRWLSGSRPATGRDGGWVAVNLPPGEVAVLAWAHRLWEEAGRGGLDGLAVPVAYPWLEVVEIPVVR